LVFQLTPDFEFLIGCVSVPMTDTSKVKGLNILSI